MKYFKKLVGERIYLSPYDTIEMDILAEEFKNDYIKNKNQ